MPSITSWDRTVKKLASHGMPYQYAREALEWLLEDAKEIVACGDASYNFEVARYQCALSALKAVPRTGE